MSGQFFWFATRSAGLLTLGTALGSVILGLLLASRVLGRKPGYPWLLDLHRFLSALSVVFLGLHMFTLWADDYVDFGPRELLIPGQSSTQTTATSWGIVAAWLLVAVQATSLLKRFMPQRIWRGVHLGAYVVAGTGSVHAWQAGSDVTNPIVLAIGASMWLLVLLLTVMRVRELVTRRSSSGRGRTDPDGLVRSAHDVGELAKTRRIRSTAIATPRN